MIIGADSTDSAEGNPFWTFSLSLYRQAGIADACLNLQDGEGLDVNLLLYAAFLSQSGLQLSGDQAVRLEACCKPLRERAVKRLRRLRRRLAGIEGAEALSAEMLDTELAAEKLQQEVIWRWHRQASLDSGVGPLKTVLDGNLSAIAASKGLRAEDLGSFAQRLVSALPVVAAQR